MHFQQPCANTGIFYIPFDKLSGSFSNSQQLCSDIHFKSPTLIESEAFESEISTPPRLFMLAKQGVERETLGTDIFTHSTKQEFINNK